MRPNAVRRTLLYTLTLGSAGCTGMQPRPQVVGFAYARNSAPYLDLSAAATEARGLPPTRLLYDSTTAVESAEAALAFAARLVGTSAVAVVVGPSNSRNALATAPAYNAAGLAHLVPSATSRRLRGAGPATFVLVPNDSVEGDHLARFAWNVLGARRAVTFYANDEYGEGLRAGIRSAFTALGGTVLEEVPTANEMDYEAVVTSVRRRHSPDIFFSAGRGVETGQLLVAARAGGAPPPVVAGDGAYSLPLLDRPTGGDLRGLYVLAFWVYDSTRADHRAFADRVRRTLGAEPTPEDALTEDALVLAATARAAAGPDRAAVRRWLAGLGTERPPFEGITGPIAFDPERSLPMAMVQFVDGQAHRVIDSLVAPRPQP
jgi:branched-chain amino acid transport system substrate-binding protein